MGFSGDPVEVRSYVNLRTTFTDGEASQTITIRYIVVRAHSSYNLLLGRSSLNRLQSVVSTVHLKVKFPTLDRKVATLRVDQATARKCYENSLKARRTTYTVGSPPESESQVSWKDRRPQPVGGIKKVEINKGCLVKLGDNLDPNIEQHLVNIIRVNQTSFAWHPTDVVVIDPNFMSHKLNIDPSAKPRVQRRRRMSPDKLEVVRAKTTKLIP